jgi:putative exporter of polyketide antibiotics
VKIILRVLLSPKKKKKERKKKKGRKRKKKGLFSLALLKKNTAILNWNLPVFFRVLSIEFNFTFVSCLELISK